ncbi:MAG: F0F1 ATP synthase subunit alpha, partial [Sedimenticolaceae bacterium]
LELEVFTRFGARLESSMVATISRGRVLREILKQGRLAPHSERFQMAWLVAFNDGLFTDISPEQLPALLTALQQRAEHSKLSLDSPREQWGLAVADWLHRVTPAAQP